MTCCHWSLLLVSNRISFAYFCSSKNRQSFSFQIHFCLVDIWVCLQPLPVTFSMQKQQSKLNIQDEDSVSKSWRDQRMVLFYNWLITVINWVWLHWAYFSGFSICNHIKYIKQNSMDYNCGVPFCSQSSSKKLFRHLFDRIE